MPRHSCCEMRVMQCMTYFFCASLQSCRRLYQMGGLTPTTNTDLLLATYRGGSHLTSDIYSSQSLMAPGGQTSAHAPQCRHLFWSINAGFLYTSIQCSGQIFTHSPQLIQSLFIKKYVISSVISQIPLFWNFLLLYTNTLLNIKQKAENAE